MAEPSGVTKYCPSCNTEKPIEAFYRHRSAYDGRQSRCGECTKASVLKWQREHPEAVRQRQQNWRADNKELLRARRARDRDRVSANRQRQAQRQRERQLMACGARATGPWECDICDNPIEDRNRIHIDHDHKTNLVRGLLCENCNRGLGMFQDEIGRLWEAICYLHQHALRAQAGEAVRWDTLPHNAQMLYNAKRPERRQRKVNTTGSN